MHFLLFLPFVVNKDYQHLLGCYVKFIAGPDLAGGVPWAQLTWGH